MARQKRDLSQSEWFHLVNRGADRQDIFMSDHDRHLYENLLSEAFERFGIELHAFAWMSNHVHQLVHAPQGGLSDAMQRLGSRYASAFNQATGRDGPLFSSRFHSTPITSDSQLIQTARYIHRNPLAFVPAAALVSYRWSSLGALCGRRPTPPWLTIGVIDQGQSAEQILRHVLTPQPSDRIPFGDLPPLRATTCDEIDAAVAAVASVPCEALYEPGPSVDEWRTLAIALAVEMRVGTSTELAQHYRLSDPRSVRRAARRGRVRLLQSERFAATRQRVLSRLDEAA